MEDLAQALTEMIDTLDETLADASVNMMCICGNTTMISILLEYDLDGLGEYPFTHKLTNSVRCMTDEIFGESFPVSCEVILSGCASAFIGGDILSGLVHLGNVREYLFDDEHTSLLLDFGTNGEMVLNHKGNYYATSTACGPAFEGCTRKQHVYGSGTIDALALGIKTGNISRDGVLGPAYFDRGLDIQGVHLDMDIIRQILPAKAAIYTGISFLLEEAGVGTDDIDKVYLAGGFGFYLNVRSAIDIGLLPKAFCNKTITVGNTSLLGACDILRSVDDYNRLESYTEQDTIKVLQLAEREQYQNRLLENMSFYVR